ncbi:MAG: GxxExxY protein, partial [Verrucomicrobiota bacterium]
LFESVYEVTLAHALSVRGLPIRRQIPINIVFRGIHFDEGFRADVIVADKVLLEIKSVERLTAVHKKQLQTYLRLTGLKLGYLLNFGEELLKNGIVRCVNGLPD